MDRSKHNGVEIFILMNSQKSLISSKYSEDACGYKKVSGSIIIFLKPCVLDTLLIGNNIYFLTRISTSLKNSCSMKYLG
jgi:hypothetical protein